MITMCDAGCAVEIAETAGVFELTMHSTGRTWGPAPLALLEIYDIAAERRDRVSALRCRILGSSAAMVRCELTDVTRAITMEMEIGILYGELVLTCRIERIIESNPDEYRLLSIIPVHGLLAISADGHGILPCRSGIRFSPRGKPSFQDRFLLYGEHSRCEMMPTLPMIATMDRHNSLYAIATQGAWNGEVHVSCTGSGTAVLDLGISLRQLWFDSLERPVIQIRIGRSQGGPFALAAIAKLLRAHVHHELGKPLLSHRLARSPKLAAAADGGSLDDIHITICQSAYGGTRRQFTDEIAKLLHAAQVNLGAVALDSSFFYAILNADITIDPGEIARLPLGQPELQPMGLLVESIPLWHLVMHDMVVTIGRGHDWADTQRAALFGLLPSSVSHIPLTSRERFIARREYMVQLLVHDLGRLRTQEILDWQRLAPEVEETTWEDGTCIVADFSLGRLTINGVLVLRPECFMSSTDATGPNGNVDMVDL
jgi:hypothetical protein